MFISSHNAFIRPTGTLHNETILFSRSSWHKVIDWVDRLKAPNRNVRWKICNKELMYERKLRTRRICIMLTSDTCIHIHITLAMDSIPLEWVEWTDKCSQKVSSSTELNRKEDDSVTWDVAWIRSLWYIDKFTMFMGERPEITKDVRQQYHYRTTPKAMTKPKMHSTSREHVFHWLFRQLSETCPLYQ